MKLVHTEDHPPFPGKTRRTTVPGLNDNPIHWHTLTIFLKDCLGWLRDVDKSRYVRVSDSLSRPLRVMAKTILVYDRQPGRFQDLNSNDNYVSMYCGFYLLEQYSRMDQMLEDGNHTGYEYDPNYPVYIQPKDVSLMRFIRYGSLPLGDWLALLSGLFWTLPHGQDHGTSGVLKNWIKYRSIITWQKRNSGRVIQGRINKVGHNLLGLWVWLWPVRKLKVWESWTNVFRIFFSPRDPGHITILLAEEMDAKRNN